MTQPGHAQFSDPRAAARVFYDGGCPVCRTEIGWYTAMRGGASIDWMDISKPGVSSSDLPDGLAIDDLMRRFTILRQDELCVSGGAGFIALWRALGPLRWLGLMADHRFGRWLGERLYRAFLRLHKLWRQTG